METEEDEEQRGVRRHEGKLWSSETELQEYILTGVFFQTWKHLKHTQCSVDVS